MTQVTREEHSSGMRIGEHSNDRAQKEKGINIVSHSMLFYWWPVWVVGFVLATITRVGGTEMSLGTSPREFIHTNTALGITYMCVLLSVIIFTNMTLRGMVSGVAVLGVAFIGVLFAWLGWWKPILSVLPDITIYMNFGFYMVSSIILFGMWAFAFFIFDRLTYWRVVPGQVTQEHLIGGGEQSYDTGGLVFEEFHDDPFRHYVLGLGTGDLKMTVRGAKTQEFYLQNVLFANSKVRKIQELIRRKPD